METRSIIISRKTRIVMLVAVIALVSAVGWNLLQPKGRIASDFSLVSLEGSGFRLSDFRGKVVVIDFMATWCGPCKTQMPNFKAIWEKYGSRMILMSIDVDPGESEDELSEYATQFTYANWIWARDTANLANAYEVTGIPKIVIVDRSGYIRFVHLGVTDSSTLTREIDSLVS